ncbi:RNA-binding protein [Alteribacter aurantiacus]|uniref:YlmH family RNA-binding protein n=1 Tax=Alteribacter aurantiacus TaxID=254410 RepID=UPI0003FFC51A|nr:RNA-binding protein [Alteribacter aurantiacus]
MSVYEHYRKDEHAFVDHVLEWKEIVMDQYSPKLTDFLDPRQQLITKNLIGNQGDVCLSFFGGHEKAERKRALLYPSYYQLEQEDFMVTLFEVQYPSKFVTIEHPHVLGALMNIGLKREKFGDILQQNDSLQFVIANEISDYVEMNVHKIGKASVKLERTNFEHIIEPNDSWKESMVMVSSLRLDTVAAEMFNLSRSKMKEIIEGEFVKVNWKVTTDKGMQLVPGDVLSVRGKGRAKVISDEGRTKKDKIKLIVGFPE